MERVFDVEHYPGEDGWWVVECPTIPGCISQGRTEEEALESIKDAIKLYLGARREMGHRKPSFGVKEAAACDGDRARL